ncbi:hypothetical protein [Neobacillus sp. D3-1R]|uniref:hypothetical protein n=1 Tax=Neobacillus sp. D3-1R TaxID=3445778 RepID=UPI003FA04BB3
MNKKFVHLFSGKHNIVTKNYSKTNKIVLGSILGAMAGLLQSAGLFTGIGYIFSTLATGPIILATILSVRIGLLTYLLTGILLLIIQPTEVLVFLFTTGILGVGIGLGLKHFKRTITVTSIGGLSLSIGIVLLLTLFQFPVLGPEWTEISVNLLLGILTFSMVFSWIWIQVSLLCMKYLSRLILRDLSYDE